MSNSLTTTSLQTTPLNLATPLQHGASQALTYPDALSATLAVNNSIENNNGSGINSAGTLALSVNNGTINASISTFNNPGDIGVVTQPMSLAQLGSEA